MTSVGSEARTAEARAEKHLAATFRMLRKRDPGGLFVDSPWLPAETGLEVDGRRFSGESLKYYEILLALHRAAILQGLRNPHRRLLVWEIEAPGGEFAYQLKSLCPNVTYVLTTGPKTLQATEAFLRTTLPNAAVVSTCESPLEESMAAWESCDFLLLSRERAETTTFPRLDLALNLQGLEELDAGQLDRHIGRVREVGCPFFYCLYPRAGADDSQARTGREILGRHYWVREVEVLPSRPPVTPSDRRHGAPGTHLVGWRRIKNS